MTKSSKERSRTYILWTLWTFFVFMFTFSSTHVNRTSETIAAIYPAVLRNSNFATIFRKCGYAWTARRSVTFIVAVLLKFLKFWWFWRICYRLLKILMDVHELPQIPWVPLEMFLGRWESTIHVPFTCSHSRSSTGLQRSSNYIEL